MMNIIKLFIVFLLLVVTASASGGKRIEINHITVIGDSLSDSDSLMLSAQKISIFTPWKLKYLINQGYSSTKYWASHFSNGPTWPHYMSQFDERSPYDLNYMLNVSAGLATLSPVHEKGITNSVITFLSHSDDGINLIKRAKKNNKNLLKMMVKNLIDQNVAQSSNNFFPPSEEEIFMAIQSSFDELITAASKHRNPKIAYDKELAIIMLGSNDMLTSIDEVLLTNDDGKNSRMRERLEQTVEEAMKHYKKGLERMKEKGYKYFTLVSLPNLTTTPEYIKKLKNQRELKEIIQEQLISFNSKIKQLTKDQSKYDVDIRYFDLYKELQDLINKARYDKTLDVAYGCVSYTNPYPHSYPKGATKYLPKLFNKKNTCGYKTFFHDGVHPSTLVHRALAEDLRYFLFVKDNKKKGPFFYKDYQVSNRKSSSCQPVMFDANMRRFWFADSLPLTQKLNTNSQNTCDFSTRNDDNLYRVGWYKQYLWSLKIVDSRNSLVRYINVNNSNNNIMFKRDPSSFRSTTVQLEEHKRYNMGFTFFGNIVLKEKADFCAFHPQNKDFGPVMAGEDNLLGNLCN